MLPLLPEDAARPERSPLGAQPAGAGDPSGVRPLMVAGASGPDPLTAVRVLVVDDDQGSREAVRVLLEQAGADVTAAASAPEARRHLRTSPSDVLVSDIAMEQESGYTLIETLRAEGLTLPSIALTGFARREDADRAYAAGFDVHLPKPVDPDVLISVVAALVRGK
jgi:CheY-like chemotaxis protein